jgi:3-oxoacyl-[acyl-carrier protein] reductase
LSLNGKVAVITGVGAAEGIGFAIAKTFGRQRATLAVAAVSDDVYERTKELQAAGYTVRPFRVDLTKYDDVEAMAEALLREQRQIDVLVNNAGIAPRAKRLGLYAKRFVDMTREEWDYQIAVNLHTTYNCIKAVLPTMIKRRYGRIVNMSSVTGNIVATPGSTAYSAAKAAVSGLTKALALEVAEYGITVNAVCPGWIDTGREVNKIAGRATPLKRAGRPEEIASLVAYLASTEASYLTGQNIVVDGGNSLQEHKGKGET